MSVPYSDSLRSVYNRDYLPWVIVLGSSLLLTIAWLAWFVLARIPVYVSSAEVMDLKEAYLMVAFAPEDIARIQPGQPASLALNADSVNQPTTTVIAWVHDVFPATADQPGMVEMELEPPRGSAIDPILINSAVSRQVTIEVEQISPLVLTLRSAGKYATVQ